MRLFGDCMISLSSLTMGTGQHIMLGVPAILVGSWMLCTYGTLVMTSRRQSSLPSVATVLFYSKNSKGDAKPRRLRDTDANQWR